MVFWSDETIVLDSERLKDISKLCQHINEFATFFVNCMRYPLIYPGLFLVNLLNVGPKTLGLWLTEADTVNQMTILTFDSGAEYHIDIPSSVEFE